MESVFSPVVQVWLFAETGDGEAFRGMRITIMICTACVVPGAHGFQTAAQTAAPVTLRSRGCSRGQRTRELLCSTESQFRYYEEWRRTGKQPQRLIPFDTARAAVQNIGLLSRDEWEEWVTDNKPGITSTRAWFMPNQPDEAYAASGWQGWDDWLGVMLSYDAAREVVATLGIKTQEQWWAVVKLEAPN